MCSTRVSLAALFLIPLFLQPIGCIFRAPSELAELANSIDGLVGVIQDDDPRDIDLQGSDDDLLDVELDDDVEFIDDIEQDLAGEDLDDIVLLGIENLTGFDLFIGFNIDDEFQGIFVFNGETVLLEYDCFETIELLFEDDFEPETGVFVEGFDLFDSIFEAGVDFDCGDVLIVTFDVDEIVVFSEPLN